jgi:cell division protein FtsI/penicillin-binding protein 2/type II secretory pathway pseudopilin PulG
MDDLQSGQARGRRRGVIAVLVVVVLAAIAVGGWWWITAARARAERAAAESTVRQLAAAYGRRDLTGIPLSAQQAAEQFTAATEGLGSAEVSAVAGAVTIDDAGAASDLTVTWTFPGDREWRYATRIDLARTGRDDPLWEVAWTPALVHPELGAGERLEASRLQPARGDIVDADGETIVTERSVVEVYVQPSRVEDVDELTAELGEHLEIDGAELAERVEGAKGDALVPVITLRENHYEAVEDAIHPLPGTVFRQAELPLAPTREFARAFLGLVGEVTAEQLEEHPERYERGEVVGRSGLQLALDERLRGTAGLVVEAVRGDAGDDEEGEGEAEGEGEGEGEEQRRALHEVPTADGRDVAITLHPRVQRAADEALADVERPSALVVIDVPSGDVVAVANGPGAGFDIATGGQYPPGSTFKVVTAARLLADGVQPDDTVPCPGTATVDGRDFGNAEDARLGDVPFATAFSQSCNTAFVELSRQLERGHLEATAREAFGIGVRWDLGIGAYAGQVPREESAVEVAAAAIGQGRVLFSPLVAADVAATVARGHWLEPRVVLEPAGGEQRTGEDLSQGDVLQRLTRAVVTEGSGAALAGVPAGPVHGKTGTAEYGDENPPRTHAWFIGYQGDLAFAVLVAETADSFGGRVAAPIAADFLTALASS